jgi:hypothetical protein
LFSALGEAERLPFRDGIFDVVFHVGGIASSTTEHTPSPKSFLWHKKYFRENAVASPPPVDLVPHDMLDIRSKEIGDGRLYCLSFRKP